jgi:putative ABC transport system substrate-binding protein
VKRRAFITLLGSTAVAWPLAASGQQPPTKRQRVGVLLGLAETDQQAQAIVGAFRDELARHGWREGPDLRLDVRFGGDDLRRIRTLATELVELSPNVIFTGSQPVLDVMHAITRTIAIVFIQVTDPVGRGLVPSLARPNGNLTGIANYDSMGGKLLEILREIAPTVSTCAVVLNPNNASNTANFLGIEALRPSLPVSVSRIAVENSSDIEREFAEFALQRNGGLIVLANPTTNANRALIIALVSGGTSQENCQ